MSIPPFLIEMFPPDKDALLHTMCDAVTDEMLIDKIERIAFATDEC